MAKKKVTKKKVARGTPKRRKKVTKKKTSKALVRRPKVEVLQPASAVTRHGRTITDGIELGELGLVEIKLTEEEERKLNEPLDPGIVSILPQGQPYVSHHHYTRKLNDVFGRLGWALVPVGKPALVGKSIVIPYILYVHGAPVSFAQGGQEFFEGNKDQSYADAVESTVASALRRTTKRIGLWLELWDKRWLAQWTKQYAIRVAVHIKTRGSDQAEKKFWWRRRDDEPFWQENRRGQDGPEDTGAHARGRTPDDAASAGPSVTPAGRRPEPPAGTNTQAHEPITKPQRQRLFQIAKRAGRSEAELSVWLKARHNLDTTAGITRRQYDDICASLEAPGPLRLEKA